MKRIGMMVALWSVVHATIAQEYKVLSMVNPPIYIGGREMKVGEIFQGDDEIQWDKTRRQALRVETSEHQQCTFRSQEMKQAKTLTLKDYLLHEKSLSTRGATLSTEEEHKAFFADSLLLIDSMRIETTWRCDEQSFFEMSYNYRERNIRKRLPVDATGMPCLVRNLFDETMPTDTPIRCTIYYKELEYEEQAFLTNKMYVILL